MGDRPQPHVRGIGLIIFMQPDIERAICFYQQLGFTLVFHLEKKWAELALGSLKIGLCPTNQVLEACHTGIVFEVDDLMHCYQSWKETISFITEPQTKLHGIMASVQDPGGNIVDLYQPTPDKVTELLKHAEKDVLNA